MKRVFCLFLSILMLISLAAGVSASNSLTTTNLPDGSLTFTINGSTLIISGAIHCDNLEKIWLMAGESERIIAARNSTAFKETLSLSGTSTIPVKVYTKKTTEEMYWSYIWQTVFIEYTAAGYRFVSTPVYDHNAAMMETWINPAEHIAAVDPAVAEKASEIVGSETDPYRKLLAIHSWAAENLYYDNDYYTGKTTSTSLDPKDVLETGRTVCQGYANLVQALCHAQGIPCILITTWSAGTGTDGFLSAEDHTAINDSNHAHAAAWVNGRWVHMDATWDSANRYENGEKIRKSDSGYLYFDTTLPFLSLNHKIITVPRTTAENTPSDWAIPEVRAALEAEIVPYSIQNNYRTAITRARFCELLTTMLMRRMGYDSLDAMITGEKLDVDENIFTDTEGFTVRREIAAANALGIVNGRGNGIFDPASGITRQEAATMLMRAAEVLGIPMGKEARSFSDLPEAAEWAVSGILYTASLKTADGLVVMNGVSDSSFAPLGTYTVEQAILTMVRLYAVHG
ncbi:MAG: S-layer homology domain-containing protein [Clostridia bacterium]|nr:S-layer homology domain-containing protein [Clostridia bacterium]